MEEIEKVPNVVVDAPEGIVVEVYVGEEATTKAEEALPVEEAPLEEAIAEEKEEALEEAEAPVAEEEAPKEVEERIYSSDEEMEARINELIEGNAALRVENARLDEQLAALYSDKPEELYRECCETLKNNIPVADGYNAIEDDFLEAVKAFNQSHAEVDYLLAALKGKKEVR